MEKRKKEVWAFHFLNASFLAEDKFSLITRPFNILKKLLVVFSVSVTLASGVMS
jgi:hypothetical protein